MAPVEFMDDFQNMHILCPADLSKQTETKIQRIHFPFRRQNPCILLFKPPTRQGGTHGKGSKAGQRGKHPPHRERG